MYADGDVAGGSHGFEDLSAARMRINYRPGPHFSVAQLSHPIVAAVVAVTVVISDCKKRKARKIMWNTRRISTPDCLR